MVNEEDIVVKQINGISKVIGKVMFHTENFDYVLYSDENHAEFDNLYLTLNKMLDENKINEAEDLLFSKVNVANPIYLQIALNFYQKLATKTERDLIGNNFTKDEILQGFFDVLKVYNIRVERKD